MRGPTPINISCAHDAAAMLTHVELTWHKQRVEHRIRFGRQVGQQVLDRHRRVVSFAPGSIFAFVRWAANDFGTIISRIDIVRAVAAGERYQTLPFVRPGGDVLLRMDGWTKVERVLQAIDAVEALGVDPADAAPDYWQHIHNRLSVNRDPARLYAHAPSSLAQAAGDRGMTRSVTILAASIASAALATSAIIDLPKPLLWNASASAPIGLYAVQPAEDLEVSDLVVIAPPPELAHVPRRTRVSTEGCAAPETCSCAHGANRLPRWSRRSRIRRVGRPRPHP